MNEGTDAMRTSMRWVAVELLGALASGGCREQLMQLEQMKAAESECWHDCKREFDWCVPTNSIECNAKSDRCLKKCPSRAAGGR